MSHHWLFTVSQGLVLLRILLISLTWLQIAGDFIFLSIFIMSTLGMSFTIIAACLHVLQILKMKSILSLLCSGHWEPHFGPLEPSDLQWIQTIIRHSFLKFFSCYMSVNKMQTLLSTLSVFPVTLNIQVQDKIQIKVPTQKNNQICSHQSNKNQIQFLKSEYII